MLLSTVSGCFRHCGFVAPQDECPTEDYESSGRDSHVNGGMNNTDVSDTRQLLEKVSNQVNIEVYWSVDEQAVTLEVLADDAIVSSVMQKRGSSSSSIECEGDMDTDESYGVVSAMDAQEAVWTHQKMVLTLISLFSLIML